MEADLAFTEWLPHAVLYEIHDRHLRATTALSLRHGVPLRVADS